MRYLVTALLILFAWSFGYTQDEGSFSKSEVEVERNRADKLRKYSGSKLAELPEFDSGDTLSTPNPTPEAVALYRFLQDMFGKRTLSGQMWVQWGVHEINYIVGLTGEKPAIAGFDYINEPQNPEENRRIIEYWQNGGIPTVMWHWGAPGIGEGYENSKGTIDIDQCFIEGTPEFEDFWEDLERIGNYLTELRDAHVPVIWRPLHEMSGNWFWWSKGGASQFKRVWIAMYDYLVHERGINNLIWTLCYTADPSAVWFPGDEYVDIAGADTYDNLTDSHLGMFLGVQEAIGDNKYPITFHENGNPPNPEECIVDGAMWSWWMIWHTDWLTDLDGGYVNATYESDIIMNLSDLPDIVAAYGWDDSCEPGKVTASIRLEEDDWFATNKIGVSEGNVLTFSVDTDDEGTWTWSGYGTDNSADNAETMRTVTVDGLGTATATFTNSCGAVTTQTFHVVDGIIVGDPLSSPAKKEVISIYPSPASSVLNIHLSQQPDPEGARVQVFDLKGGLVLEEVATHIDSQLDISRLQAGIYSLVIFNAGYPSVQKFVVR